VAFAAVIALRGGAHVRADGACAITGPPGISGAILGSP
jgi:hypothetical protein